MSSPGRGGGKGSKSGRRSSARIGGSSSGEPKDDAAPFSLMRPMSLGGSLAAEKLDSPSGEATADEDGDWITARSGMSPAARVWEPSPKPKGDGKSDVGGRYAVMAEEVSGKSEDVSKALGGSGDSEPPRQSPLPGGGKPSAKKGKGIDDDADARFKQLEEKMASMVALLERSQEESRTREAVAAVEKATLLEEKARVESSLQEQLRQSEAALRQSAISGSGQGGKLLTAQLVPSSLVNWFKSNPLKCELDFGPQYEKLVTEGLAGHAMTFKNIVCKENWIRSMGDWKGHRDVDGALADVLATWPDDQGVRRTLQEKCKTCLPCERDENAPFLVSEILGMLRKRRRLGNSALLVGREMLRFERNEFRPQAIADRKFESMLDFHAFLREEARGIRSRLGGALPTERMSDALWLRLISLWPRRLSGKDRELFEYAEKMCFDFVEENLDHQFRIESEGEEVRRSDLPHPEFMDPDHVFGVLSRVEAEVTARKSAAAPSSAAQGAAAAAKATVGAPAEKKEKEKSSEVAGEVKSAARLASKSHPLYVAKVAGLSGKALAKVERDLGKQVLSAGAASPAPAPAAGSQSAVQQEIQALQARVALLSQGGSGGGRGFGGGKGGDRQPEKFGWDSCVICGAIDHGVGLARIAQVRAEGKCPSLAHGVSPAESAGLRVGKNGTSQYENCWQCNSQSHMGRCCFYKDL